MTLGFSGTVHVPPHLRVQAATVSTGASGGSVIGNRYASTVSSVSVGL